MESVADFVWTGLLLSVAVAVNENVPVFVGVPEITPLPAARLSPAGKLPLVTDQAYEGVPPVACSTCEYAVPSVPDTRDDVVIVNAFGAMVIDRVADFVWTGLLLSVAVAVNENVPLAVGVPEITPLPDANASPAGRLPEVIDHA